MGKMVLGNLSTENAMRLLDLRTLTSLHEFDWFGPIAEVYDVDFQGYSAFAACSDSTVCVLRVSLNGKGVL